MKNLFLKSKLLLLFIITGMTVRAQQVQWTVVAPTANSVVDNDGLFVQLLVNDTYSFQDGTVQVLLDGKSLNTIMRMSGNKLSIIYEGMLPDGKHSIEVKAHIPQAGRVEGTSWDFIVNKVDDVKSHPTNGGTKVKKETFSLSGQLSADSRNEMLSGEGKALRQEPALTRTLNLDMTAKYKGISIPVKLYTTSDKRFTQQSPEFYSVGLRANWLEADMGDMNPALDRLILTGVRMRGGRLMLKSKTLSLQMFYGYMNQAYEGRLETYAPGIGVIPSSLVSDTQYIVPGAYKRWMAAARLEKTNRKGTFKIGFNAFKAKDDTTSIKHGLEPKDNLAASMDMTVKLFKKRLTLNTSAAASILTKDTKYGAISNQYLDSVFNVKTEFNPANYQSFIVLNASSVPISVKGNQFLAYYAQAVYSNKFNYTSVEYRRNGAAFFSLGNPFLRSNYIGISVSERLNLIKSKLSLGGNFQQYTNNLNEGSATTNNTTIYGGNAFFNLSSKLPSLFVGYMQQSRITQNSLLQIDSIATRRNTFNNITATLNYNLSTGNFVHSLRTTYNSNMSNDESRADSKVMFSSMSVGLTETMFRKFSISADAGKTILTNAAGEKFSDILTYSAFAQYTIDPKKAYAAFGVSNNTNAATLFANESTRMSLVLRGSYKFYKGMGIYVEAASQPYREMKNALNNFDEKFVYVRYTYDFDWR